MLQGKTLLFLLLSAFACVLLALSCATDYPYEVLDPPWIPQEPAGTVSNEFPLPTQSILVPIYYSQEDIPVFDGAFNEWQGLDGPITRLAVFGGSHNPADAEAFFVLRTDGNNLFVYARVSDDTPRETFLPGSLAWRDDSLELFFGSNLLPHEDYVAGDNQVRIVPRSKSDIADVDIVINQRTVGAYLVADEPQSIFAGAVVYNDAGYEVEVSIPLSLMQIPSLVVGQQVRNEFQVNDADETERDRMIHWISERDEPWFNASVWGNGIVVALPETRSETPNEL